MLLSILLFSNVIMTNFDIWAKNISVTMNCENDKEYVFKIENHNADEVCFVNPSSISMGIAQHKDQVVLMMYPVDTGIKFNSWKHPDYFCVNQNSSYKVSIKKEVFKIGNISSTYKVDSLEFSFANKLSFWTLQGNTLSCENDLNGCSPQDDLNKISKMSKKRIVVPKECSVFVKGYRSR